MSAPLLHDVLGALGCSRAAARESCVALPSSPLAARAHPAKMHKTRRFAVGRACLWSSARPCSDASPPRSPCAARSPPLPARVLRSSLSSNSRSRSISLASSSRSRSRSRSRSALSRAAVDCPTWEAWRACAAVALVMFDDALDRVFWKSATEDDTESLRAMVSYSSPVVGICAALPAAHMRVRSARVRVSVGSGAL